MEGCHACAQLNTSGFAIEKIHCTHRITPIGTAQQGFISQLSCFYTQAFANAGGNRIAYHIRKRIGRTEIKLYPGDTGAQICKNLPATRRNPTDVIVHSSNAEIRRKPDFQTLHTSTQLGQHIGCCLLYCITIPGITTCHHTESKGCIPHRAGEWSTMLHHHHRTGRPHRNAAKRGFKSHYTAKTSRPPYRTARVGACSDGNHPGRYSRTCPAARTTGGPVKIPGIVRNAMQFTFGDSAPCVFRGLGLAQYDRTVGLEPFNHDRIDRPGSTGVNRE